MGVQDGADAASAEDAPTPAATPAPLDLAPPDGLTLHGPAIGLDGSGIGLDVPAPAPDGPGVAHGPAIGLDGSGIGLDGSGIGLDGSGIGLDGSGVGLDGSGVGLDGSGIGLDGAVPPAGPGVALAEPAEAGVALDGPAGPGGGGAGTGTPVPIEPAPARPDPTAGALEIGRDLGDSAAVVSDARAMVTGALLAWGAPESGLDDCVAVASELVANAVVHAAPPLHLRLALASPPEGTVLRIEVSDGSTARPQWRPPTTDQPGGRGLLIVRALAHRYGISATSEGKTMWAEVLLG